MIKKPKLLIFLVLVVTGTFTLNRWMHHRNEDAQNERIKKIVTETASDILIHPLPRN